MAGLAHPAFATDPRAIAFLSSPLAISETGLAALIGALQSREPAPLKNAKTATKSGSVAVIPVSGPLSGKDSWLSMWFGSSSYETVARDLSAMLADDEITAIVLDIDSPGGDAAGCGELSKFIYASRGKKPIIAYCAGSMCSAAYWIGSAADSIVADQSSLLGSIGVRSMMVDASAYLEKLGIKEYAITSKQSPHKVLDAASEEDRARLQDTLTSMAAVFIADVARNRNVSTAAVESQFGKGGVLVGADAVAAKLADRVGTLDALLSELNTPKPAASMVARAKRSNRMAVKAEDKDEKMACKSCKASMGAEDDMYCMKCFEDDDEEGEEAKSARASLLAITGKSTVGEAIAALAGWKQAAADVAEMRASIEAQKKIARLAEFDAVLASMSVGDKAVIPPAADHPRRVFALKYRESENGVAELRAYAESLGSAPAPAVKPDPATPPVTPPVAQNSAGQVSPELAKHLAIIGLTPEKFAEAQKRYAQVINPVEVK